MRREIAFPTAGVSAGRSGRRARRHPAHAKQSFARKGVPKPELERSEAGLATRGSSGIFANMTTIDDSGRIAVDPAVCNGRPVVKGTRIAVQTVLEFLGAGDGIEDMLEEYPVLTREDVLACLQFSSRLMGNHFTLLQVA